MMVYRQLAEWYVNRSNATKTLINGGLIYGGISALGNVVAAATGSPPNSTIDTLVDMAAPLLAGQYLFNELDRTNNSELKNDLIKTGIWAFVGYDLARELMNNMGGFVPLDYMRNAYYYFNSLADIVMTNTMGYTIDPAMKATVFTGFLGGLKEFFTHKRSAELRRRRHLQHHIN